MPKDCSRPATFSGESDGLWSHRTAFYAILQAHEGCQHGHGDEQTGDSANSSATSHRHASASNNSGRSRSSRARRPDEGEHLNDSEDDEQQRSSKRRKASQQPGLPNTHFACPFNKYDAVLYAPCEEWHCEYTESVKKHVLGARHRTSLHMSPDKAVLVQGIPPSRTGPEGRWQAIFHRLFGTTFDIHDMVPSPYWEARGRWCLPKQRDIPVPPTRLGNIAGFEHRMLSPSVRPIINLHASAYVDEAQRLTEVCNRRRNEVRLRQEQRRTEVHRLDFEARQLDTDLTYNLSNLGAGMEEGLSLEDLRQHARLVTTAATEPLLDSYFSFELPELLGRGSQGLSETYGDPSVQDTSSAPTKVPSSNDNDSGLGTMESDDTCPYCNGTDDSCLGCGDKWLDLSVFD